MCVLERSVVVKNNPSLRSMSHLLCRQHWKKYLELEDPQAVNVEVINPKLKDGIHYTLGDSNLVELKPFMTTGQLLGSPEADGSIAIASNGPGDIRNPDSDDDEDSIDVPSHPLPTKDSVNVALNSISRVIRQQLAFLKKNTMFPAKKTRWKHNGKKIRGGAVYRIFVGNVVAWIIHDAMCNMDRCDKQVTSTSFSGKIVTVFEHSVGIKSFF